MLGGELLLIQRTSRARARLMTVLLLAQEGTPFLEAAQ
jgi:hypothetical protein